MKAKIVTLISLMLMAVLVVAMVNTTSASGERGPDFMRLMRDWIYRTDYCVLGGTGPFIQPLIPAIDNDVQWDGDQSFNLPKVVSPGQQVTFTINLKYINISSTPKVYFSVYGDWAPVDPLFSDNFTLSPPEMPYSATVTFTAPYYPGTYRIRWMDHFAFAPIHSFFGGTDGEGVPGYGDYTSVPHHWSEFLFEVK